MNVGICISVRMNSKRLPGKAMMKIAGSPSLYWLCKQLKSLPLKTVVCHSTNPLDQAIVDFCEGNHIEHFAGSEENVLERFVQAADKYGFTHIIRVTGDDIFVDPTYVDRALQVYRRCEYATTDMPKGTDFQILEVEFLKRVLKESPNDTEYLTYLLEMNATSKQFIQISPAPLIAYAFELDEPEDQEKLEVMMVEILINTNMHPTSFFSVHDLLDYAEKHPGVFKTKSVI